MCLRMLFAALCVVPGVLIQPAAALESDAQQPIHLEADWMSLDQITGLAHYKGNVRLTQGSIRVQADEIIIHSKNDRVETMNMTGKTKPATFQQQTDAGQLARGQAMEIEFTARQSKFVFMDSAELEQGSNHIRSSRIDYNSKNNSFTAGPSKRKTNKGDKKASERVRIVITPQEPQ